MTIEVKQPAAHRDWAAGRIIATFGSTRYEYVFGFSRIEHAQAKAAKLIQSIRSEADVADSLDWCILP